MCAVVRISQAVEDLGLPPRVARRLSRALDGYVRHRRVDSQTLRWAVRDAVSVLAVLGGDPAAAVRQLEEAVAAHARERGHGASSVLAVEPVHRLLAAEVAEWAARVLGVPAPHPARAAARKRATVWQERAVALRSRKQTPPSGDGDRLDEHRASLTSPSQPR